LPISVLSLHNALPIFQLLMISFATGRVDRGGDGRTPVGIAIQPVLNLSAGSGELRLNSSDPTRQPCLDFHFLTEEFDRRRLRERSEEHTSELQSPYEL